MVVPAAALADLPEDIQRLSNEVSLVACPCCLQAVSNPRTLPCKHTLCKDCILRLASEAQSGPPYNIQCPSCRLPYTFNSEKELKEDVITQTVKQKLHNLNETHNVMCERCDRRKAAYACKTCDSVICAGCCDTLHQGKLKQKHEVSRLDNGDRVVRTTTPKCTEPGHGDYGLDLYDPIQKKFLCLKCYKSSPGMYAEAVPTLEEAERAKVELGMWLRRSTGRQKALATSIGEVDGAIRAVEGAAEQEQRTLEALLTALIEQLERQAGRLSGQLIQHREHQVRRLCDVRQQIMNGVAANLDYAAQAQRAFLESDPVDLIEKYMEMASQPWDMQYRIPRPALPVVGPGAGVSEDAFMLTFSATDQDEEDEHSAQNQQKAIRGTGMGLGGEQPAGGGDDRGSEMSGRGKGPQNNNSAFLAPPRRERGGSMASVASSRASGGGNPTDAWCLDAEDRGGSIELAADGLTARSLADGVDGTSILGTHCMRAGAWAWKLTFQRVPAGRMLFFGVTGKPFQHVHSLPHSRIWGWTSQMHTLPQVGSVRAMEAPRGELSSGDEVYLLMDCDKRSLTCFWQNQKRTDTVSLGSRNTKSVHPVVTLGGAGAVVEITPLARWPW